MKTLDNVGVTFVNIVLGRGSFNGNVNLTLGVMTFEPKDDGTIDLNPEINARLRMDIPCARQLRDNLDELLASIDNPKAPDAKANGAELPSETVN